MEIISIPLKGSLKHKDTMGNKHVIKRGEVQVMSAGTGIAHSEYNNSETEDVNFLQIWVMPRDQGLKPEYGQKEFNAEKRQGQFQLVVSPDGTEDSLKINQDAYFSLIDLKEGTDATYKWNQSKNLLYLFLIEGQLAAGGETLTTRDALGVEGTDELKLKALKDTEVLLIEVPA